MHIGILAATAIASLAVAEPAHAQVVGLEDSMSTAQAAGRLASQFLGAFGLVWMIRLTFSGVRRRRAEWSRREWIRFSCQLSLICLSVLTGLGMGAMVDRGIYDAMPRQYHHWYLALLMTLSFAGAGSLGLLLYRFAKGP
jgi:hypothetical protein